MIRYYYPPRNRSGKNSPVYLGDIAERALPKFFDHIERMPYGNPGYDFICGKDKTVDVKGACRGKAFHGWNFTINKNQAAQFFLCIGFDDRDLLNILHVWLIPGNVINHLSGFYITDTEKTILKWRDYEIPID